MQEHYFSENPLGISNLGKLHDVPVVVRGRSLVLKSSPKVFSTSSLDLGTAQLLAKAPSLPKTGTFLDLGCGWGPVAVTMALDSPDATVWAVDVNERALALTRLNCRAEGVDNVVVFPADEALRRARDEGTRFDVIWSNPPIRVGKEALHDLLLDWLGLLADGGHAYLVVNRNLGADSLAVWLRGQGFAVDKLASRKGFRILDVSSGGDN